MEPDGSRIKIGMARGLAAAAASLSLVCIGCYRVCCTLSIEVQRFGRYRQISDIASFLVFLFHLVRII